MQNVYKLTHLVRVEIPGKYKKLKTNEANISQVLKTTVCVLCYRLRHMLSQAKYSQYTQGLIEKNNLGVGNVNTPATRCILGYYTLYRLLTFRSKLDISLLFCF